MRGLLFFGICLVGIIVIIMFVALVGGVVLRLAKKSKQRRFIRRSREELRKRFPFLPADQFFPIITQPSPCCKKMMWKYDNKFTLDYFCDNCGKRYKKKYSYDLKEFTEGLDYLAYERDLSALNKFWKLNP